MNDEPMKHHISPAMSPDEVQEKLQKFMQQALDFGLRGRIEARLARCLRRRSEGVGAVGYRRCALGRGGPRTSHRHESTGGRGRLRAYAAWRNPGDRLPDDRREAGHDRRADRRLRQGARYASARAIHPNGAAPPAPRWAHSYSRGTLVCAWPRAAWPEEENRRGHQRPRRCPARGWVTCRHPREPPRRRDEPTCALGLPEGRADWEGADTSLPAGGRKPMRPFAWPRGGIGRHRRLGTARPLGHVGSTPTGATIFVANL